MGVALQLHGITAPVVAAIASKVARSGGAISQKDISAAFQLGHDVVSRLFDDRQFVLLVRHKVNIILNRDGLSTAVQLLISTARDPAVAIGHRLRAVELILSRTVPSAPATQDTGPDRELTDMSAEELRSLVDGMQSELAQRATPINAVPINPGSCFD